MLTPTGLSACNLCYALKHSCLWDVYISTMLTYSVVIHVMPCVYYNAPLFYFTGFLEYYILFPYYIPGYTLTLLNVHVLTLIAKQFHQKHRWK